MRYYRAAAQIVELPDGPAPALIKPGTDVSATLTCHCGQELEAGWAYCPSCSLSTKALAASKEPSRADLVNAELQRQRDAHAAAFERPVTAWRISRAAGSCAASGASGSVGSMTMGPRCSGRGGPMTRSP